MGNGDLTKMISDEVYGARVVGLEDENGDPIDEPVGEAEDYNLEGLPVDELERQLKEKMRKLKDKDDGVIDAEIV